MKLVVPLKLSVDAEQALALLEYMTAFNAAATEAARVGFGEKAYRAFDIQKLCYQSLRKSFGVSSQTAVRAIAKAAEALTRDETVCPEFRPLGAATYDQRTFSLKGDGEVSLLTQSGRIIVPFSVGEYFKDRMPFLKGQADLVHRGGEFYLYCTADVAEPEPVATEDFLGVDLGIVNIATDSEGERHTGEHVERHRKRHARSRRSFQRRGTKSAKRRLRKLKGKQSRYQKHVNHCVSKRVVAKALELGVGVAVEDLRGIRGRVEKTVGRKQRPRLSNWAFSHLRQCLEYKARLSGVLFVVVDPRDTSRTCSSCGHCEKGNRKSQALFSCLSCGHSEDADVNAARNISRLGRNSKPASKVDGRRAEPQSRRL